MVRSLLLCRLCHRFCHLLVVIVDALVVVVVAIVVVIFVIVVVVIAMVVVARAGARARGEQRQQQQQQCRALGVSRTPPRHDRNDTTHGGGEEAPVGCRCGMRSSGRCPGRLRLPEECIEARGRM